MTIQECLANYYKLNEESFKDLSISEIADRFKKDNKEFTRSAKSNLRNIIKEIKENPEYLNKLLNPEIKDVKTVKVKTIDETIEIDANEYNKALNLKSYYESLLKEKDKKIKILQSQYDFDQKLDIALAKINPNPIIKDIPKFQKYKRDEKTFLSMISDLHYSEKVSKEHVYKNEYNIDIFNCRLFKLLQTTCLNIEQEKEQYNVNTLHVFLGGDFVSGDIHEELRNTNELNSFDSCEEVVNVMIQFVETLLKYIPFINIFTAYGNHGRIGEKVYFKDSHRNYDYWVYRQIQQRLKNYIKSGKISMEVPKGKHGLVDVLGHRFLYSHGEEIKSTNQISLYNIQKKIANNRELHGRFSKWLVGHAHKFSLIDDVIVNGSIVGFNEYSLGKYKYEEPIQLLLEIMKEYEITNYIPIKLGNAKQHEFNL
jgi:hypothetical protein